MRTSDKTAIALDREDLSKAIHDFANLQSFENIEKLIAIIDSIPAITTKDLRLALWNTTMLRADERGYFPVVTPADIEKRIYRYLKSTITIDSSPPTSSSHKKRKLTDKEMRKLSAEQAELKHWFITGDTAITPDGMSEAEFKKWLEPEPSTSAPVKATTSDIEVNKTHSGALFTETNRAKKSKLAAPTDEKELNFFRDCLGAPRR